MLAISAQGRVAERSHGGPRSALQVSALLSCDEEEEWAMRFTDDRGFQMVVRVPETIRTQRKRIPISAEHVQCVLADGTEIACEGYFEAGRMRLDAVNQDLYHWFWLEVSAVKLAAHGHSSNKKRRAHVHAAAAKE